MACTSSSNQLWSRTPRGVIESTACRLKLAGCEHVVVIVSLLSHISVVNMPPRRLRLLPPIQSHATGMCYGLALKCYAIATKC
jgi:hypothetical protein